MHHEVEADYPGAINEKLTCLVKVLVALRTAFDTPVHFAYEARPCVNVSSAVAPTMSRLLRRRVILRMTTQKQPSVPVAFTGPFSGRVTWHNGM